MSADLQVDSVSARGLGEPFYFGSAERRLFGWLHRPSIEPTASIGLVLCNPFGYEAICSHRGVRTLAEQAAAIGVPALRFDYLGTGDSANIDPEADQIDVWSGDVLTAVNELQQRTGVERVYLLGFRLGGLLAAFAAMRCKVVDGLILIAPVINGPRYLRELRTIRLASGYQSGDSSSDSPADERSACPGSLEVSGYSLSARTIATLKEMELSNLRAPPAAEMLVIDGSSRPLARGLSDALSTLGARTQYLALPGLIQMIMTAPQVAVPLQPMINAISQWLRQRSRESLAHSQGAGPRRVEPRPDPPASILSLPGNSLSQSAIVTERPAIFASETLLFGIITEPQPSEIRRRAVIFLNAGADHHIGASRIYVSLARRWARHGYFVLRMDLGGVGDSSTRPGTIDDEVFPPTAIDDIRAGIELLRDRYGTSDITLVGICSGAYHALRAAVAGLSVTRLLMVNPQNFFWKKGTKLEQLQPAEVVRNPGVYRKQVLSGVAWKRLLSGQVDIWRIMQIFARRPMLALESVVRDLARRLRIHLPYDLGWELEEIVARGVKIVFVFSRGEPGIDLLKIEGGSSVRRLGAWCRVRFVDGADHMFSNRGPRAELEDILSEELFARDCRRVGILSPLIGG